MAVIKDVAERAGVSVGTVSKYLHRPDSLKPANRQKIEAAIRVLEYHPSRVAQSMRSGRAGVIAVAVPDIMNPFFAEAYSAIHRAASQVGVSTLLYTTDFNSETLRQSLSAQSIRQVDGVILCFVEEDEPVEQFLERVALRIPVVLLSRNVANSKFHTVAIDVFEGLKMVVEHLLATGRKRIAYVGGTPPSQISDEKHLGFIRALAAAGMSPDETLRESGEFTLQTGYAAARKFMMRTDPPDAIVAENDLLAIGCLKYLLQSKIAVPRTVAVTGFDDIRLSAMYEPALTTVTVPLERMASEAIKMMIRALESPGVRKRQSVQKIQLVVRASTDAQAPTRLDT